jgi:hypothetical protein
VNQILAFLVSSCSFLWSDYRYRIIDSQVSPSFGGDAWLIVASERLRLRFVRDRSQLFLDLQGTEGDEDTWYSIDLLWRLLLDQRRDSGELDPSYAEFLAAQLPEIEQRLSDPKIWPQTRQSLKELKRKRAKELFG